MKTNFKKGFASLTSLILVALLAIGSGYAGSLVKENKIRTDIEEGIIVGAFNPTGGGTYRLKNSISSTASSITLTSFKEPVSNTPYSMSYLNTTIMYGTIEPLNPDKSEFISFTGITQNSDGTATLTGVSRGLARSYPYTASTTHAQTHSGQSIFILSDTPQLFNTYLNSADTETITGNWTYASTSAPVYDARFNVGSTTLKLVYADWVNQNYLDHASTSARTLAGLYTFSQVPTFNGLLSIASSTFASGLNTIWPTASSSVTSKGYVDAQISAGCTNASQTTSGCVEEATVAEINSGASTGATGAKLFMTPSIFSQSNVFSNYRPNISIATSSNTDYIASTTQMTVGQQIVWEGVCARGAGNGNAKAGYKLANEAASTTIISFGAGDGYSTAQGLFVATTTVTITVDMSMTNGCDQGASLITTLYK